MKSANSEQVVLAGDIGGTKTNLGLFRHEQDRPALEVLQTYASSEASSLEELIGLFLRKHPAAVTSACFGIPGPVIDGVCKTTNLPWVVSESEIRQACNIEYVELINDLAATAKSIPVLTAAELHELNAGKPDPEGMIGLVAPGTGLGVGLLLFVDGKAVPIASEGGHADFAPRNEREIELLRYLLGRMPHVSVERLVSGPGLFTIYSWMKESRDYLQPDRISRGIQEQDPSLVISEVALEDQDPLCVEALDLFVSILGSVAGNLALTAMTTGGIYIGGGIAPKILPKLKEGIFMEAFSDKGRFKDMLTNMPVRVILNDKAALLGAACQAFENLGSRAV